MSPAGDAPCLPIGVRARFLPALSGTGGNMRVPFLLLVSLVTPDVALASLLEVARERCAARLETGPTLLEQWSRIRRLFL